MSFFPDLKYSKDKLNRNAHISDFYPIVQHDMRHLVDPSHGPPLECN